MKRITFPFEFSHLSARAMIYRNKSQSNEEKGEKGYEYYKVVYYDANRKRKARSFSSFEEALAGAKDVCTDLSGGNADVLTLTRKDKHIYERAIRTLIPLEVDLDFAACEYAEAVKRLGGVRLKDAVDVYLKHHPKELPQKTVREVVDELIESKRKANRAKRYIEDLTYRLGGTRPDGQRKRTRNRISFADAFQCNLSAVTSDQIQKYLDGLKLSPRSYENFRTTLTTLFEFAKLRKYLPKTHDEVEHLLKVGKTNGHDKIDIFEPAELCKLLEVAPAEFVPYLAIGAFAGLRNAELDRLDWSEVRFDTGFIEVKALKAKTKSRRLVPITANLAKWLQPYSARKGKVVEGNSMWALRTMLARMNAADKEKLPEPERKKFKPFKWKHNGLRHSFISYRVADTQNVNQVALEAGNSPAILFSNYREVVTPAQAKAWFCIEPTPAANVVDLKESKEMWIHTKVLATSTRN